VGDALTIEIWHASTLAPCGLVLRRAINAAPHSTTSTMKTTISASIDGATSTIEGTILRAAPRRAHRSALARRHGVLRAAEEDRFLG
jgi:2-oxo-4-hydroxy-4-carboxy--5-ureidoimidazoline (OHCU) decarboxylase